jgi:hypothetical protein
MKIKVLVTQFMLIVTLAYSDVYIDGRSTAPTLTGDNVFTGSNSFQTLTVNGNSVLTNSVVYDRLPFDPNTVGSNTIVGLGRADDKLTALWMEGQCHSVGAASTVYLISANTNTTWAAGPITTNATFTFTDAYTNSTVFSSAVISNNFKRGIQLISYSPACSNLTVVVKYVF